MLVRCAHASRALPTPTSRVTRWRILTRWRPWTSFVAPGEFAVAENAAVWVTDQSLRHRVLYFLSQHMALVVPANQLLHNMHEAYRRLSFDRPQFGLFISGPSKTADIEQSLVIGAHGPRSLTVFLMEAS